MAPPGDAAVIADAPASRMTPARVKAASFFISASVHVVIVERQRP
jgi:hypothetical protein